MSEIVRVPSAPGSSPDGLSPSVSGHSPCDPSRWELSEETRAYIREVELLAMRPGDPRLSRVLIGPVGPAVGLDGYGSQAQPLAQSVYSPPRCTATGNPCGTDTVMAGRQCPDPKWSGRCAHKIAARVAAQGIEARSAETRSGAAEGESPVGRETDAPEELQAKATQNRDEVRV